MSKWRMVAQCANCPFHKSGPGFDLRKSLGRGRWKEITDSLKREGWFACHKTTGKTDDDDTTVSLGEGVLMCAGAIEYQQERGVSSNLQRCMESIDWMVEQRKQA